MRILHGHDEAVAKFVSARIPHAGDDWGPMSAVGVLDSENKLIAGAVFSMFYPEFGTIQVSMAADSPRWATKKVIREILSTAFDKYGCNKVWTSTPHKSDRVIKFNKRIGFTEEAVLRDHFGKGSHATICRMLKKDFVKNYG